MSIVTSTDELAAICKRFAHFDFVTVDTEFMRETTYWPKLCVVQMASPEEAFIIDAMAPDLDLAPFFKLMKNEKVVKVFHAARQDIEIVYHLGNLIPHPVFDTQVAAMVCGFGDSISYDQLVQRTSGARLDKSSRFTDWSRRPLSQKQIDYALADVTHLREVYLALSARLDEQKRSEWVREEMEVLTSPDTYRLEPDEAWKRLKLRVRKPVELAILQELAAWREREAQSRDVPRGRVLKDDAIYEIAQQQPTTPAALAQLRTVPKGFERSRAADDILAAAKKAVVPAQGPDAEDPEAPRHFERQRRCGRPSQGSPQDDQRGSRRRRQGHCHGRRSRGDRRRRPCRRPRPPWLAARAVRRDGAQDETRRHGARRPPEPRGGNRDLNSQPHGTRRISGSRE